MIIAHWQIVQKIQQNYCFFATANFRKAGYFYVKNKENHY